MCQCDKSKLGLAAKKSNQYSFRITKWEENNRESRHRHFLNTDHINQETSFSLALIHSGSFNRSSRETKIGLLMSI